MLLLLLLAPLVLAPFASQTRHLRHLPAPAGNAWQQHKTDGTFAFKVFERFLDDVSCEYYIYMYIYVANFRFFEPKLIGCLQVLYQRCIYYLKNTADTMWADVTCGAAGTPLAVIQLIQLEPGKKWSTISWDWGCTPPKINMEPGNDGFQ